MATARTAPILRHLHRLAACAGDDVPDSHLLARFARLRDQDAFSALIRRHGPLVLGVGCRVLGDIHAAEDCLQAIARYAADNPDREWITGDGWAMNHFEGGSPKTEPLDAVRGGRLGPRG